MNSTARKTALINSTSGGWEKRLFVNVSPPNHPARPDDDRAAKTKRKLRMLELCAGIGGASLAAEWTNGIEVVGQVECENYCNQVLEKHWPDVPRMKYLQEVRGDEFGAIDICVTGLPCQPFSSAGKKLGSRDERNLWPELRRILDAQCRRDQAYRWLIIENVQGILHSTGEHYKERKGGFFQEIVETLGALGYRVGWAVYGAFEVGAPHRRERVFIVAHYDDYRYGKRQDEYGHRSQCETQADACPCGTTTALADAQITRYEGRRLSGGFTSLREQADVWASDSRADVADTTTERLQSFRSARFTSPATQKGTGMEQQSERYCYHVADPDQERCGRPCQSDVSRWQPLTLQGGRAGGDSHEDELAHTHTTGLSERQREDTRRTLTTANAGNATYGKIESPMGREFNGFSYWLDGHRWPSRPGEDQYEWEPPRTIPRGMRLAKRVPQLKALGNAIVPQQIYPLLSAIVQIEQERL